MAATDKLSPAEVAFRALLADPVRYATWAEQTRQEWAERQPAPAQRPVPQVEQKEES
jgi:hypothetical protein